MVKTFMFHLKHISIANIPVKNGINYCLLKCKKERIRVDNSIQLNVTFMSRIHFLAQRVNGP